MFSQHIMGYDPSKKAWVMAYRRVMGYPPYPNSGRAKKYGVPGIMGYQDLWVKGTSTVQDLSRQAYPHFGPSEIGRIMASRGSLSSDYPDTFRLR